MTGPRLTVTAAREALARLGVALHSFPGEYGLTYAGQAAKSARRFESLAEALAEGYEMALGRTTPTAPPVPFKRRITRRQMIRRHNARAGVRRMAIAKRRYEKAQAAAMKDVHFVCSSNF